MRLYGYINLWVGDRLYIQCLWACGIVLQLARRGPAP
jgi:hypothetical protein